MVRHHSVTMSAAAAALILLGLISGSCKDRQKSSITTSGAAALSLVLEYYQPSDKSSYIPPNCSNADSQEKATAGLIASIRLAGLFVSRCFRSSGRPSTLVDIFSP